VKTFWTFTPWLPWQRNAGQFLGRYEFLNSAKVLRARPVDGEFARTRLPTAQIKFIAEDFDKDCFQFGALTFVSEKMRRAMALGPSDIQYFDVDTSQSTPLPRSKLYQIMHIPVTEDVSEPEHSDFLFRQRPDGIEVIGDPTVVAFRPNAEPAHEIFHDRFFKVVYCTDEFALRVLRAGCTGMRFLDAGHPFGVSSGHHRTLRGVEEDEWDQRRKIFRSKVIREIP
jgi:hypothetical protein